MLVYVLAPLGSPEPDLVVSLDVGRRVSWLWNRLRRTPAALVAARVMRFVPGRGFAADARSVIASWGCGGGGDGRVLSIGVER